MIFYIGIGNCGLLNDLYLTSLKILAEWFLLDKRRVTMGNVDDKTRMTRGWA
jgi:hypothetical protein